MRNNNLRLSGMQLDRSKAGVGNIKPPGHMPDKKSNSDVQKVLSTAITFSAIKENHLQYKKHVLPGCL